jgi:hypothetical protein
VPFAAVSTVLVQVGCGCPVSNEVLNELDAASLSFAETGEAAEASANTVAAAVSSALDFNPLKRLAFIPASYTVLAGTL